MVARRYAYDEVADRLREEILAGRLTVGQRLPTEPELCAQFGVSRSTIREALRTLSSQRMVTTTRGVTGGSAVARLGHEDVTEMLRDSIMLLSQAEGTTVAELLETRELLEIPAARLAAKRRSDDHIERLRATIPADVTGIAPQQMFEVNRSFHDVLLEAAGNRMLAVVTEPTFSVMQQRFIRGRADIGFWNRVMREHRAILRAVERGDEERAAYEMNRHLKHLRKTYEAIDVAAVRPLRRSRSASQRPRKE